MTGAMYAAIGGLRSHMSKLNVIGNNVANVNTHGYKAQRMTFKESMYTTSRSGSNGGTTSGGNNPSQIGYGCSVGSIDLNMSPSTYAPTGWGLDCMIDGEGFFMVGDKVAYERDANGNLIGSGITSGNDLGKLDLTRVGDFWVDPDGYICNRDGKVLYGFARVQNPKYDIKNPGNEPPTIVSTELVPLRVPLSAAKPTTGNGGVTGTGNDAKNLWNEGDPVYPYLSGGDATTGANGSNRYPEPAPEAGNNQGGGNQGGGQGTATGGGGQIPVARNTAENRVSDVVPVQLKSMGIGKDGSVYGIAANGDTVVVGYVAIASADSPDGVTHIDGPYYKCQGGAGNLRVCCLGGVLGASTVYLGNKTGDDVPAIDAILNEKTTEIRDGGLEASSTDVANEFAEMITTQRGYQANTRIITVTDSMLEELVNMKR